MRWLITGGCGFIGTSLIAALTEEGGHTIRIIDNFCGGTRNDLSSVCGFTEIGTSDMKPMNRMPAGAVELIDGDVVDGPLAFKACAGADVIVHLAANTGVEPSVEDPALDCTVNVFGTLNMLEAARQNHVARFVFASSGAPIGECEPPIHEELAPHPVSPYGASKLAGEGYCSAYYGSFGLETVALRFGNVYGPGSGHKTSVVAKFIRNAMQGEVLEIFGDGQQTRDFVFIDDLVRAIRRAATVPRIGGEIFQIATSSETTVGELVNKLKPALADAGIGPVHVHHTSPRVGDVKRNFSDTSKARTMLGWQAAVTLDDGLRQTVAWFVARASRRARSVAV
jgi:UDP-glucose 4-epimerase